MVGVVAELSAVLVEFVIGRLHSTVARYPAILNRIAGISLVQNFCEVLCLRGVLALQMRGTACDVSPVQRVFSATRRMRCCGHS